MTAFSRIIDHTLRWETGGRPNGGLHTHPDDPGGTTKWGIAQRYHPEENVKTLTLERALEIYRWKYFLRPRLHLLPEAIAMHVFDQCVNVGTQRGVELLQHCVGAHTDGRIGPRTLAQVGMVSEAWLCSNFAQERASWYLAHAAKKTNRLQFRGGWIRRTVSTAHFVGYHLGEIECSSR